ncbi:senescence-associated protein AAF, chlorolplastic isoform X2 [Nymphaea colorata]|nr:senescence-associated protein AAF, chlorolplastic isoform X2 [Nymphaea colorata]
MATDILHLADPCGIFCSVTNSPHKNGAYHSNQKLEFRRLSTCHSFGARLRISHEKVIQSSSFGQNIKVSCGPSRVHETEACERRGCSSQNRDGEGELIESLFVDDSGRRHDSSSNVSKGLAEACKFACNDAKYVNERARNDIVLLSRGITRLNNRARQDVAILGLGFLKLDARAREDTEKIDHGMKIKAARLQHMAKTFKDEAQTKLKKAADRHWSDGALEADLRRADFVVKRRAMEDAFMALQFVKNIHDMMVNKMYQFPRKDGVFEQDKDDLRGHIMLEKNGKTMDFLSGEISSDRIAAIQEAYLSMATALSEADGIDYTDPEELELLVATLIDLDAMDGKSSVSLLAECSSSPDVGTRQALANALAAAPSMWTLGNAGMGALQRLAQDSNPAVAAAATNAINELKRQWEIKEGDSWVFTMSKDLTDMESVEDVESGEQREGQ